MNFSDSSPRDPREKTEGETLVGEINLQRLQYMLVLEISAHCSVEDSFNSPNTIGDSHCSLYVIFSASGSIQACCETGKYKTIADCRCC